MAEELPDPESGESPLLADKSQEGKGKVRRDAALVRRALRERWPIPPETRARVVERLDGILKTSQDKRSVIGAAKALVEADRVNQEQERRDQKIPDRIDLTTGGLPLPDAEALKALDNDELRRRIAALEGRRDAADPG